jgi:hypothetical protein
MGLRVGIPPARFDGYVVDPAWECFKVRREIARICALFKTYREEGECAEV